MNKILEVQLPYLLKDIPDENIRPVFIDVEFGLDDEPTCDEDVHGECVSLGEMFDMKWYRITLARNLTRERLIRLLSHELVHVMQEERGDEFDYSLPYSDQPHEIEAYGLEDELVSHFGGKI